MFKVNVAVRSIQLCNVCTVYAACIQTCLDMFIKHQLKHINFMHNSLFLKFPYTYFGGLNHHLQGVAEII